MLLRQRFDASGNARTKTNDARRGAAAVEFAIAMTVLFLFVFASIEFVRLSMLRHSVEYASYLGARRGIIIGTKAKDAEDVAKEHLIAMGLTGGSVTVDPNNVTDETQMVEVSVNLPVTGNSWISPVYFGGTLTGRTRMYTERVAAEMSSAMPASGP